MSPSSFKGFVLLGFLCLWVSPSEQELTLQQHPNPAVEDQPVSLMVSGVDPNSTEYFNWYQSNIPDTARHIIGYVRGRNPNIVKGKFDIGPVHTDSNGTLTIEKFSRFQVTQYTIQLQAKDLQTATIILLGNNSPVISNNFFLLAMVLLASLKLL